MPQVIAETLASSSAHGISRAAAAKTTPLKAMWILLFLIFLALFLNGGIRLLLKLNGNKLTKEYHLDEVSFVFPDLYFCPSNPYSGTYPFLLKKSEAEEINAKISMGVKRYENLYNFTPDSRTKVLYAQTSLSFHLTARHLILRKEQSVLNAKVTSDFQEFKIEMVPFYTPENLVCFKAVLDSYLKNKMALVNSMLEVWLSTDPYFADFNFKGYPIKPLTDTDNVSVPFLAWHPTRIVEPLKISGYNMLIVPPGAYPSMKFESNFHLAPGNAYSVKLRMEENACNEKLHQTHCVKDHPKVAFINPYTLQPESFEYNKAACYYQKKNSMIVETLGCQLSLVPQLWNYRNWPRCLNASELTNEVVHKFINSISKGDSNIIEVERNAAEYCKRRIPCMYAQYSAVYSFGKWPSSGSSTDQYFANSFPANESVAPALAKLVNIAKQLQAENHTSHLENLFRSYVSESLVSVSVSALSLKSPQVMLTWSYTFMEFLADAGGLLGLYIGCSALTLCELLELLYIFLASLRKRKRESQNFPKADAEGEGEVKNEICEVSFKLENAGYAEQAG